MIEVSLFIGALVGGIIWGFATQAVIDNKGYSENWFWWGFWFGFIAFIVALTKQDIRYTASDTVSKLSTIARADEIKQREKRMLQNGGWKCICGNTNPSYTGTCACGKPKKIMKS